MQLPGRENGHSLVVESPIYCVLYRVMSGKVLNLRVCVCVYLLVFLEKAEKEGGLPHLLSV